MPELAPAPVVLLTPPQVGERLGYAVSTLAKMRCLRSDGPPFMKFGSSVRYDEAALAAWISSHPVRRSTSDPGIAA